MYLETLTEPNSFMTPLQRLEDRQRGAQSWVKVHHSLELINASEAEMKAIFSVLAAIYHLGVAGVTKGEHFSQMLFFGQFLNYLFNIDNSVIETRAQERKFIFTNMLTRKS